MRPSFRSPPPALAAALLALAGAACDKTPKLPDAVTGDTPWAAGVARRALVPDHPVPLGGYGLCSVEKNDCRLSEGVHDEPSATAVALADTASRRIAVFVGIDSVGLLGKDRKLAAEAAAAKLAADDEIHLSPDAILVGSSHAHTTPDTVGLWSPKPATPGEDYRDQAWVTFLVGRIAEAVVAAVRDLADVELRRGDGSLANGDDDKGEHDHDLFTLEGRTPAGAARFTLVRWAGHPTVYGLEQRAVSADYVGVLRNRLEAERGGLAVFLNGSLASVYPHEVSGCGLEDPFAAGVKLPGVPADQHEKTRCTGLAVFAEAKKALDASVALGAGGLAVRHAGFQASITNVTLLVAVGMKILPVPDDADLAAEPALLPTGVTLVRLGDVEMVALGGEASPSFSAAARAKLAGGARTVVLGMINDWLGYMLTAAQWEDDDFEYHRGISPSADLLDETLRGVDAAAAAAPLD